jgi:hypothetical protein
LRRFGDHPDESIVVIDPEASQATIVERLAVSGSGRLGCKTGQWGLDGERARPRRDSTTDHVRFGRG